MLKTAKKANAGPTDRQTDRPTNQQTDIVTYRVALQATKNWIPQSIFLFLVAFYSGKHVESRYISPSLGQVTSLSSHFLIAMTAALDCVEVAVAIKIW